MKEILHIFKKDVRHHWPEILVSLAFLGLYLKFALRGPDRTAYPSLFFFFTTLSAESVPPLLVLFWIFLTVRIVHEETLVGDRQWWVTKPYEWWHLLAAKELFQLAFIALPLFAVQLYLLRHAGFPILPNLVHLLETLLALGFVLFLPAIALGCLTRTLWQAVIAVILAFACFAALASLFQKIPSAGMSSSIDELSGGFSGFLVLACVVGAVCWQYARRRTWASRVLLVSGPVLIALVGVVIPYARFVEKKYPLSDESAALAHFTPVTSVPRTYRQKSRLGFLDSVYVRVPLAVSGIAPGRVIIIDGIRPSMANSGHSTWDPGWEREWTQLWPESRSSSLDFEMQREEFESFRTAPVRLHLELALTEFQETAARDIILSRSRFTDERLGICHLDQRDPSQIDCLRPFQSPGGSVSFDPSLARCPVPDDAEHIPEDRISHFWLGTQMDDDPFTPGLNPVADFQIYFGARTWQLPSTEGTAQKTKKAYLCPGAKVRLAQPGEKTRGRVQLDVNAVHLQDFADIDFE